MKIVQLPAIPQWELPIWQVLAGGGHSSVASLMAAMQASARGAGIRAAAFVPSRPEAGTPQPAPFNTKAFDADASRLEIAHAPHGLDQHSISQAHRVLV
ncbi:hypothetical protein [Stappia sp. P2PMeth1]|uniref:hypothetical protein n=1 Tax=Stappia sp. P2PMeth1 TaxID=2003586 RepID=UPI0016446A50|nr:hypothetical protein [Stappia sp. P2PMeth1]